MVYCFLAEGFEEIEALAAVDMLRRAGIKVETVGVGSKVVKSSHSIIVESDIEENEIILNEDIQAIILPGGMPGTKNLEASETVQSAIDYAAQNGKLLCAICAAPSILGHKGLLANREAIAFPGFEKDLFEAVISKEHVAVDGNFITAKGAGVAVDFSLAIVAAIKGQDEADKIRKSIQCLY